MRNLVAVAIIFICLWLLGGVLVLPVIAGAELAPVSCSAFFRQPFEVGEWVWIRASDEGGDAGLVSIEQIDDTHNIAKIVRVSGTVISVAPLRNPANVNEFSARHIRRFDSAARAAVQSLVTRSIGRGSTLITEIEQAGGRASFLPNFPSEVVIEAAPRAGVLAPHGDPQLLFNDPDYLNELIAKVRSLGGVVVWLPQPLGAVGTLGSVATGEVSMSGREVPDDEKDWGPNVRFLFRIGRWSTRAVARHELVHVDDIITNPIPELELLNGLVYRPNTVRDWLRNRVILDRVIGTLEVRAYAQGNGLHILEGHRSLLHHESILLTLYAIHNRFRLAQGNFLADPNRATLLGLGESVGILAAGYSAVVGPMWMLGRGIKMVFSLF